MADELLDRWKLAVTSEAEIWLSGMGGVAINQCSVSAFKH